LKVYLTRPVNLFRINMQLIKNQYRIKIDVRNRLTLVSLAVETGSEYFTGTGKNSVE
jgi:hypothetical protein